MKRKTFLARYAFLGLLMLAPLNGRAQQYSETASTTIYDFSKFGDEDLLDLFARADAMGRKYPTTAELKDAGIYEELEFIRSHVRKRKLIDNTDRLVSKTYAARELFLNLPSGAGKGTGGYPSKDFASDNFSMWNYTHLFGSWNHSLFQAPGAWTDAAHRNGSDIMSGIKFFDGHNAANGWMRFISKKNAKGDYKYARPIINLLRFMGMDGINYNWEASGYGNGDVVAFHRRLYEIANEEGFDNFHIVIYTINSSLDSWEAPALFGSGGKRTAEVMLNYDGSGFSNNMRGSVQAAEAALGTTKGLYAGGWIVGMDKNWTALDRDEQTKKCGIALWGEHDQSRFWSYNSGGDPQERMSNYQMLLERAFSGGHRNPAHRPHVVNAGNNLRWNGATPPLSAFAGMATWIPERSAISGTLPFVTHFNVGNGARYNYKGKKTSGSWYNLSAQDIVPTYRWLVYQGGTNQVSTALQPEFTNRDAYMGGSCLQLSGKESAAMTDVVLYKTDLHGTAGNIYADVAVKNIAEGSGSSAHLYLIVRTKGSADWKEFLVPDAVGKTWQEHRVQLTGLSSADVIDRIGLRVKDCDAACRLLVGKLQLHDSFKATPAGIEDLTIEVKEETRKSLSVKAVWHVQGSQDNPVLMNDDAHIDHFEVLYKNGENGRVSEIARTSQWAAYVGDIQLPELTDRPFIGVRAVATDLKTYSPVLWQPVTRADQQQLPEPEEDSYGKVELDLAADGAERAQRVRYLERVETAGGISDILYTANKPTGGANYVDASKKVWKVRQGQQVTLKLKGYEATDYADNTHDDLRYCIGRAWMDFDGNHQFDPRNLADDPDHGECLFSVGKYKGATIPNVQSLQEFSFKIPDDARVGKSRLRIVFSDAWFEGALQPVGKFNKGFAIDFGVEITGDNASRGAAEGNWDQGIAEQPDGLDQTNAITQTAASGSSVRQEGETLLFTNVDRAWLFTADGMLIQTLERPSTYSLKGQTKGVYLLKMQSGNVIRVKKIMKG